MNDFLQNTLDEVEKFKNYEYMPNDGAVDDIFTGGSSSPNLGANNFNNTNQSQEQKPQDWYDWMIWIFKKLWNLFMSLVMGLVDTLIEIFQLIGNLNVDQFISIFKKMFLIFGPIAITSLATMLIGIYNESTLAFLGYTILIATILDLVITGLLFLIINLVSYKEDNVEEIETILEKEADTNSEALQEQETIQELTGEYESTFDDIMNEILGEDTSNDIDDNVSGENDTFDFDDDSESESDINLNKQIVEKEISVDNIDGSLINSKWLFDKFNGLFPTYNPTYNKQTSYEEGSDKWKAVFAVVCNVFKDLYGCKDIDEVLSTVGMKLETVYDSSMSTHFYIIKPPKGKPKSPEEIKETLEFYQGMLLEALCNKKDLYTGVKSRGNILNISVELKGDRYDVIISKPNKNPIYIGDVLQNEDMQEVFRTSKNMPYIIGVDDLGNSIYTELCEKASEQYFSIIGGGPGTGKSFAMDGQITQLIAFNSPKDIQFIFVDPKGQDYGKFEVFPHVLKIMKGSTPKQGGELYELLKYINEVEYVRRSKLFDQAEVQNIQAYRKKGNEMPYLYILLEEYMSIRGTMWPAYADEYNNEKKAEAKENKEKFIPVDVVKEMDALLVAGVTRWRTAGIFLTIVSHRFTGYITPAARNNASSRMVLKNETTKKEVFDDKEIKENPKVLMNTGEFALKIGELPLYTGKTVGVTIEDSDETNILHLLASSFYKMQVDMPTEFLKAMKSIADRKDYNKIKDKLKLDDSISFDKYNIFNDKQTKLKEDDKNLINTDEDFIEDDSFIEDNSKDDLNFQDEEEINIEDEEESEDFSNITIDEDGTIHDLNDDKNNEDEEIEL